MKFSTTNIRSLSHVASFLLMTACSLFAAAPAPVEEYYTEPQVFSSRPNPTRESKFGDVGVTGLKLRVATGVVLKVDGTTTNTPADGKFAKDESISGVNGVSLKGRNPFVVLGDALTQAEAKDGKLLFDVISADEKTKKQVAITIPVLGAYSPTWPLKCTKSQAIIKQAAAYYSKNDKGGVEGALACLFLLSTGDDQYLPVVKSYFDKLSSNVSKIGDHTWNNGYNGIACAEYYLRTGDASVLPVIQYYCDDAKARQMYGIGWPHWGGGCNPRYVAGGLMNPAAAQVVTTLLLAKECGVNVDEPTLMGSLKFFYRFAGHGTVAYGDHRGEGGLGSNGKDGMAAAIMQIASEAQGNVEIYKKARDSYAQSMLDSYPCMVTGHADEGRGDAIWRGINASYMRDVKPAQYAATMNRIQWWCDLSRRPDGGLGVSSCQSHDDEGSGASVALLYTASLKTLRITGAPRSKHAKPFTLPSQLWGRKADLDFLSIENGAPFKQYGSEDPTHVPFFKFGGAYNKPDPELAKVPRAEMLKNVYHHNYLFRAQAAKALKSVGALDEIDKLLQDKDPRVRRAALDGLIDFNYWFAIGKDPIRADKVTPGMIAIFRKMIADPEEALYVVDGALFAMSCAPASAIAESLPIIQPWTVSDEWWLRQSAFTALAVAAEDEALAPKLIPILGAMFLREERPQAREYMTDKMAKLVKKCKPGSESAKSLAAFFKSAVEETPILPGVRAGIGGYYVKNAMVSFMNADPKSSLAMAKAASKRLPELRTDYLVDAIQTFVTAQAKLPEAERKELVDLLYGDFRQDLIRRMKQGDMKLDSIMSIVKLKDPNAGWREIGAPFAPERVWQFTTVEPQAKDILDPREGRRFRDVKLPAGLEKWQTPTFDASQWTTGKAPIGKGVFKPRGSKTFVQNRSVWGTGEFLLARTTFELDSLDYDFYRICVLANQGYRVFLNGKQISQYGWWAKEPIYTPMELGPNESKHLKKGTNVLAVYVVAAPKGPQSDESVAQFDIRIEGLRKADLLGDAETK